MTAAEKPHPLYLRQHTYHSNGLKTNGGRTLNWSAKFAFKGGRGRGVMRRLTGKLVAVTWEGYFTNTVCTRLLTVETAGSVTVFTLTDKSHGVTRHLDSFTAPADVNGLFLACIDPADPFAVPLTDYLVERDCPPDILAFFW